LIGCSFFSPAVLQIPRMYEVFVILNSGIN
jgi:hypothetical protein